MCGTASADASGALRRKHAEIHRGSWRPSIRSLKEAGYTFAIAKLELDLIRRWNQAGSIYTYGNWVSYELSFENARQIWIPIGFLTRRFDTEVLYKCTEYYAPDCEGAMRWDSIGGWNPSRFCPTRTLPRCRSRSLRAPLSEKADI